MRELSSSALNFVSGGDAEAVAIDVAGGIAVAVGSAFAGPEIAMGAWFYFESTSPAY